MEKKDGGPAFPTPIDAHGNHADYHYSKDGVNGPGMSLRDHFAGLAMPPEDGRPANPWQWLRRICGMSYKGLAMEPMERARRAYAYADAMILARSTP